MIVAAISYMLGPYFLQVAIDEYIEVANYKGLTLITLLFLGTNLINMACMEAEGLYYVPGGSNGFGTE